MQVDPRPHVKKRSSVFLILSAAQLTRLHRVPPQPARSIHWACEATFLRAPGTSTWGDEKGHRGRPEAKLKSGWPWL